CRFTAVIWRKLKVLRTTPALFLSALHPESHGGIFPLQAHPVIFNINGKSFHKRADFGCRYSHAQNVVLLFIAKRAPLPGKVLKDNGPLFFSGNSEQLILARRQEFTLHPDVFVDRESGCRVSACPPYLTIRLISTQHLSATGRGPAIDYLDGGIANSARHRGLGAQRLFILGESVNRQTGGQKEKQNNLDFHNW